LGNVETKIARRIACNNFTSTAGTDTLWRRHCFVVSIVKPTGGNNLAGTDAKLADGARQVKRKGDDDIPDWPQPQGVYAKGTHFYPIEFLKTLRDMYKRVVVRDERSADLPVEYEAFGKVLQRRTIIDEDGSALFRLYDLLMPPSAPDSLVVLHNGHQHLRLDCLWDN
ncbi:hypothetical protein BC827DRAFT_1136441, partial [Russula dissimulans]